MPPTQQWTFPNKYCKWKKVSYTDDNGNERLKLVSQQVGDKQGYRIVNLECLQQYITDITVHCMVCKHLDMHTENPVEVIGEVWHQGLASVVAAKCNGCCKLFELKSPRMRNDKRFEINVRAVWGQMVTGGGASHLSEQCATMGMPGLSQTAFSNIEEEIGSWWKQVYNHVNKIFLWTHL